MSEYVKGKSYTSSYINNKRTKIAHEMQKESGSKAKSKAIEKKKGSYYGSEKQQRDIDKNVKGVEKYNKEHPIRMSH